jgi:hypothetical protein
MTKFFSSILSALFMICMAPGISQALDESTPSTAAETAVEASSDAVTNVAPEQATPAPDQSAAPTPAAEPVKTEEATRKLEVLTQEEATPKFVVFLPEQIDMVWYWYFYTEEQQHIVQSAVEKALMKCNYEVIDLSLADLFTDSGSIAEVTSPREAVKKAAQLGATYAIIGKASATMTSRDVAYGVNVVRSSAEAEAKVIRVSDGKVMALEEASSQGGGQAQKAAAQGALKEAGARLGSKLCSSLNLMLAP